MKRERIGQKEVQIRAGTVPLRDEPKEGQAGLERRTRPGQHVHEQSEALVRTASLRRV